MFSKKQMSVIAVLAIFVLATMAMAYGLWTDKLTVTGSATTGTMAVQFVDPVVDTETELTGYDTSIATCVTSLSTDAKTLTVTIVKAYPGYVCTIDGNIKNVGSVPVKITGVSEYTEGANDPDVSFAFVPVPDSSTDTIAVDGTLGGKVIVTTKDNAAQNKYYTGSIKIDFEQLH